MSNASLRPSKIKSYLDKKHPQWKDDRIDALPAKKVRYDLEAMLPHLGVTVEEKPTLQSRYEMAYQIVKCKKPHTIAEELVKPCAKTMVEIMIGSGAKKKIQQVLLSHDTICHRIDNMTANVCQEVCSEIKQNTLQASIQLDESTDSALESHLIAFARYEKDRKMKEEFLFINTQPATTTAADVKALADSFFEANELNWQNFKLICTDGAPAMIGAKSWFVTLVKSQWPHVTSSHCSPHRYTLTSKTLPLHLMEAMDVAVRVINFIRLRAKITGSFNFWAKK